MYAKEQKLRAMGLLIKCDFSPASVVNELGLPLQDDALQLVPGISGERTRLP